jgi:hypothetical protein
VSVLILRISLKQVASHVNPRHNAYYFRTSSTKVGVGVAGEAVLRNDNIISSRESAFGKLSCHLRSSSFHLFLAHDKRPRRSMAP